MNEIVNNIFKIKKEKNQLLKRKADIQNIKNLIQKLKKEKANRMDLRINQAK